MEFETATDSPQPEEVPCLERDGRSGWVDPVEPEGRYPGHALCWGSHIRIVAGRARFANRPGVGAIIDKRRTAFDFGRLRRILCTEPATWPRSALASKFDCFCVHPNRHLAKTANTGLAVTKLDLVTAVEQAAPLSTACHVWRRPTGLRPGRPW